MVSTDRDVTVPRVLHVSQPVDAGVAEVVAMAAADQRSRGWDVALACPPGPLAERARATGVRVRTWRAERGPGPATLGEVVRLRRIIAEERPDAVHLHSAKAGLAGRLALRGHRPTVFQPHAWSFQAVTGAVGRASLRWERLAAARWTDRLVCVSADEQATGTAAGIRAPTVLVPNGVDTDRLRPGDGVAARAALGLVEAPTVLCVGRVTEQKGQDLLLRAWPRVLAAAPDARLVIVGDGPELQRWRDGPSNGAHPSVTWLGHRPDPMPYYAAADVLALPSRWEGMALVPLEAMSCGRPVVGFDVGGVAETVADCGAVVAPGDTEALAGALALRLLDRERAEAEGARARARVVTEFGSHRVAGKLADTVLEAILDSPRRRVAVR